MCEPLVFGTVQTIARSLKHVHSNIVKLFPQIQKNILTSPLIVVLVRLLIGLKTKFSSTLLKENYRDRSPMRK